MNNHPDQVRYRAYCADLRWHAKAACKGTSPAVFYNTEDDYTGRLGQPSRPSDRKQARQICLKCQVQFECLVEGLADIRGIRAGMNATERREAQKCCWCGRNHIFPKLGATLCQACEREHKQFVAQRGT